jgi:hypothetical protein
LLTGLDCEQRVDDLLVFPLDPFFVADQLVGVSDYPLVGHLLQLLQVSVLLGSLYLLGEVIDVLFSALTPGYFFSMR